METFRSDKPPVVTFLPHDGGTAHSQNVPCRPHATGTNQQRNKHGNYANNIPLRRRPLQRPGTNAKQADHEAANTTVHQQNRCSGQNVTINRSHASRPTPNWPGMHRSERECRPASDTMMRRDRRPPYPRTQQNTTILLLRTRPTNVNKLHYTTLGQSKTRLFGDATTGSSATEPTQTKPTMRRPRQPRTNHTAAAAAT